MGTLTEELMNALDNLDILEEDLKKSNAHISQEARMTLSYLSDQLDYCYQISTDLEDQMKNTTYEIDKLVHILDGELKWET
jgi:hypothetical protein